MKKLIGIISVSSMMLIYTGCANSYVGTNPDYGVVVKPQRPDSLHFWIEGDWVHDKKTDTNMHTDGYWSLPVEGRTFQTGYWKTNRKGTRWVVGRWVGNVI